MYFSVDFMHELFIDLLVYTLKFYAAYKDFIFLEKFNFILILYLHLSILPKIQSIKVSNTKVQILLIIKFYANSVYS